MDNNLVVCSFSGVDKFIKPQEMESLYNYAKDLNINIEFGLLYSYTNTENKYIPLENIINIIEFGLSSICTLHICGKLAVTDYINGVGDAYELSQYFHTVQLNFKAQDQSLSKLKERFENCSGQTIITQHNEANRDLWHQLGYDNHSVLYDMSGGHGLIPSEYLPPMYAGKIFGYAGGLSPESIPEEFPKILKVVEDEPFWIDMESGIRSDGWFDINKCKIVINYLHDFYYED